jgi:phage tail-like protein
MSNEKEVTEGLTTSFRVIIPGLRDMVFKSCEGMELETEVMSFYEGGRGTSPRTVRGSQRVNKISFSHGSVKSGSNGSSLFDWYLEVCDLNKPLTKKTVSIIVTDQNGKDLAEWRILNAWPCRWVAPIMNTDSSQLTVEYTSFAHEGIERKK